MGTVDLYSSEKANEISKALSIRVLSVDLFTPQSRLARIVPLCVPVRRLAKILLSEVN